MKIVKHWLEPESSSEKIVISKSGNAGTLIDPDYLVLHYTATDDAKSAINWFMNTGSNPDRIAAHIVLDLDGTITQLVPFNQKANHAGTSCWDNVDYFNSHSIGIEIVNAGFVEKMSNGSFRRFIGLDKNRTAVYKTYPAGDGKITKSSHKHKFWNAKDNFHWHIYPDAQLKALYKLSKALFDT